MKLSKGIQFFAGNTQTTYDLTNLNLSAGTYAITVIAEAEGFTDSDVSNSVNYTVTLTDPILFEGETSDFTLKATNKTWNGTVEYSTDKNTWNTWDGSEIPSANKKLYLRGKNNTTFYTKKGVQFVLSAKAGCYGNINTLLDYKNPPISVGKNCYRSMFRDCTSLTTAPELPATKLESSCYYDMFLGCTSLTTGPSILPATTLASGCYQYMFYGCTSLTSAPELPATTLANGCYQEMFLGCTPLTTAPALPATTLKYDCYHSMFQDCTSLKISSTQTGKYTIAWRIPSTGEITSAAGQWNLDMLKNTGGTFTENPSINTTYYGAW